MKYKMLLIIIPYVTINIFPSYSQDTAKMDSLETVLQIVDEDTSKLKILTQLCWDYKFNHPVKGLRYAKLRLELSEKLNLVQEVALSLNLIGEMHRVLGDYGKALDFQLQSLRLYESLGNKESIARILNYIGIIYHRQNNHEKTLEYYFKSLKIVEDLEFKVGIAHVLDNIGLIFQEQDRLEMALEYQVKSLKLSIELGDKRLLGGKMMNIATTYMKTHEYEIALEYLFKSLKYSEELNNKHQIAMININMGDIYSVQGKDQEAIENFKRSLIICKEIEFKLGMKTNYAGLSEIYAKRNRYKEAYEFNKLHAQMTESLFNEERSKDIGRLEGKHEYEMKEMDRKSEEEDQERIQIEQRNRRDNLQYSGILVFLAVLLLTISFSSRLALPIRVAEGSVFFTFLLFFEFSLVYLDPSIEQWTNGEPAYKLFINAGLAGIIFPLHQFFEAKMKKQIFKAKRSKVNNDNNKL